MGCRLRVHFGALLTQGVGHKGLPQGAVAHAYSTFIIARDASASRELSTSDALFLDHILAVGRRLIDTNTIRTIFLDTLHSTSIPL